MEDQAVCKCYSVAQAETFIWAALSLQKHFIHLTEEHVNTVCNSPFKGHQPAFVEHFEEPLFRLWKSQPSLFLKAWNEKKGQEEGKLFPGALQCCNADTVSCGKKWRSFSSDVVYVRSLLFTFAFKALSSSSPHIEWLKSTFITLFITLQEQSSFQSCHLHNLLALRLCLSGIFRSLWWT